VSRAAGDCLVNQWFRFALGRMESSDDACVLSAIRDGFAGSGGDIRQLLVSLVRSDAFRYVRTSGSSP
jgi:hypothetical protein